MAENEGDKISPEKLVKAASKAPTPLKFWASCYNYLVKMSCFALAFVLPGFVIGLLAVMGVV